MKTAVEWLNKQLQIMDSKSYNNLIQIKIGRNNYREIIQQAKEMEKEQIMDAWLEGNSTECDADKFAQIMEMEQYYTETFKSE
jgi:hypothetical protein